LGDVWPARCIHCAETLSASSSGPLPTQDGSVVDDNNSSLNSLSHSVQSFGASQKHATEEERELHPEAVGRTGSSQTLSDQGGALSGRVSGLSVLSATRWPFPSQRGRQSRPPKKKPASPAIGTASPPARHWRGQAQTWTRRKRLPISMASDPGSMKSIDPGLSGWGALSMSRSRCDRAPRWPMSSQERILTAQPAMTGAISFGASGRIAVAPALRRIVAVLGIVFRSGIGSEVTPSQDEGDAPPLPDGPAMGAYRTQSARPRDIVEQCGGTRLHR